MTSQPPTATSEAGTPLAQKLSRFVTLSLDEIAVLQQLQATTRSVRRDRDIVTQGQRYDALLVMMEGISLRYRILHDGRRQILSIALPGDFVGFPACFFENALYSISALTDTVLAVIPFTTLIGLFGVHSRLATAIFWCFASEAAIYTEHLTDVGRRTAIERVAHFLLELLTRFQIIGLADERSFPMPLTQELIGDALGLSVPHVNRTLRQLRGDELVAIEAHRVTIKDIAALSALADFERSYLSRFRIPDLAAGIAGDATTGTNSSAVG
jgi:CRP-like cAMP-binding protein